MSFAPGSAPGRSQAQFPRRKLWAPKVKTGCLTCRRRRVKCDESKPSCKRCLVSRQECVYSSARPVNLPTPESPKISYELDFRSSSMYKSASQSEKDAFFRFYTVATEQIAGSGDYDFWTTVVPQLAQMYPPVWHAVNAMSTVYAKERIRGGDDVAKQNRNQYYQFALEQYGKSVEETLAVSKMNMEVIDKEVILTTSIIMCCMALLMADRKMAVKHSWHAFRLFREWSEDGQAAGIDTGITQGFLTKMLKDFPAKLAQQSTAPGPNGEAAVQRMLWVDEIQEPTTGCVLIVELWSFDFEAEFHISFARGPEITYEMFLNDFEAILELGWQSFHKRKNGQSREMHLVLQAVIGASQTKTIYTSGPDPKCANPSHCDGESTTLQYPWPSDFFDVKVILDNIAQGSMAQYENLMWSGLVGLGSCECSDDEVCGEHRVPGTGVPFLDEEGIHAVLNAVSRVVGNRPGQHIRLRW